MRTPGRLGKWLRALAEPRDGGATIDIDRVLRAAAGETDPKPWSLVDSLSLLEQHFGAEHSDQIIDLGAEHQEANADSEVLGLP